MTRARQAAGWIAEALATGNPLAELPPEIAPRRREEGERVALLALHSLGIVPCGLRLAGAIAGPMVEARMLPNGATAAGLRHPVVTAALIGVLAEALEPEGDAPPRLSALHPALDIADHRFTRVPLGAAQRAADLGGLGFVVAGAGGPPDAAFTPDGAPFDPHARFAAAASAARRMGGLPRGALLVLAGLSAPLAADAAGRFACDFGALGRVGARIN